MLFGLTLNFISITCILFAFVRFKAFTSINILIVNLAVSDILYTSIIPAFVKQFEFKTNQNNDSTISMTFESSNLIVCRLSFSLDVIGMIVSVYTVAALTIERYYFIKDKTKIHENDKSKLKIILIYILLLWTSAICFSMPKTISIHIYGGDEEKECTSSFNETDEKIFTCLKLLIAFAIPYLIINTYRILLSKFVVMLFFD